MRQENLQGVDQRIDVLLRVVPLHRDADELSVPSFGQEYFFLEIDRDLPGPVGRVCDGKNA